MREVLIASLVLVGACGAGTDGSAGHRVEVVDSAGIRIMTHVGTALTELAIDTQPELIIGQTGPNAVDLFRVRGGVLLASGGIAVANAGSQEVLVFGSDGVVMARAGGDGEGPEQFSNLTWIQGEEDEGIVAYDGGNRRLTRLDMSGGFLGTRPVRFDPARDLPDGAMPGQGFVLATLPDSGFLAVPRPLAHLDGEPGELAVTAGVTRFNQEMNEVAVLDDVRMRTWYETPTESGPPIGQVLHAPVFQYSAHGRWLAYTEARTHRVVVVESGALSHILEEVRPRSPFATDSVPQGFVDVADSLPAYDDIQVDGEGRVWLRASPFSNDEKAEWRVFSADGETAHGLTLPASTRILDADGERLLLLELDELDVETVAVRRTSGWLPERN